MSVCFLVALASGYIHCTPKQCSFLGVGYNIISGDPYANQIDPGYANQIFDEQWINTKAVLDNAAVCNYDSVVSEINGGHSAQESLKKTTKISGSAGGWGATIAFTGSQSVNTMKEATETESMHFAEARASCQLFFAKLPAFEYGPPPMFGEYFNASVYSLPANKSSEGADGLLKKWMIDYGTHYTRAITMGGMMVRRWTMTESSYNTLQTAAKEQGFSVEAGYKGLFSASAGASHSTDSKAVAAVKLATSDTHTVEIYKGGTPFVSANDTKDWAAGLKDHYVPVAGAQNELREITELLTPLNFPGLDSGVQATAEAFFKRLCTKGGPNLGHPKCTPDMVDPLLILPIIINTGSPVSSVTWVPDYGACVATGGVCVATGDADNFARTWDVITGEANLTLYGGLGSGGGTLTVAYSPDGKYLASGNTDGSINIWDTATGRNTHRLLGHTGSVLTVAYSPDGKHLASGGEDLETKIWETATGNCTSTLLGVRNKITAVVYSPDGKQLATGSCDPTASEGCGAGVWIWDAQTLVNHKPWSTYGVPIRKLYGHTDWVNSLAYSPDGKHLASGSSDQTILIWDTATGQSTLTLDVSTWVETSTIVVKSVAYSPDGKFLASGSQTTAPASLPAAPKMTSITIWDTATGKIKQEIGSGPVNSVAYSPDGKHLATGSTDMKIRIWSTAPPPPPAPQLQAAAPQLQAAAPQLQAQHTAEKASLQAELDAERTQCAVDKSLNAASVLSKLEEGTIKVVFN